MTLAACFGDEDAVRLVTGAVDTATRERLNGHAEGCPSCHRRVVDAAQALVSRGTSVVDWDDQDLLEGSPEAEPVRGHTVAGRYVVLDVLGSGGMGTVYLAHDAMLRREVALKVTRRTTPLSLAALQHEARAIAAVRHAHVVTVFDLAVDEGRLAIAMEYIRGPTLRTWLVTRRPGRRATLDALWAMGDGLNAAHAAGVVHGDVKLDNALVDEDGAVRLADFGLARLGAGTATRARGPTGGTLAYLAPEVAAGNAADCASDQFALAASWVEAITGRRPAIDRGERWVDAPLAACPRWLRRPLARALSADPRQRYPSVAALLSAVRRRRVARRVAFVAAAVALALAPWLTLRQVEAAAFARCLDDARATLPQPLPEPDLRAVTHPKERFALDEQWHSVRALQLAWAERWTRQQARLCRDDGTIDPQDAPLLSRCLAFERAWMDQLVAGLDRTEPGSRENLTALGGVAVRATDFVCDDPAALTVFEVAASAEAIGDAGRLLAGRADATLAELDALVVRLERLGPSRVLGWALVRRGALHYHSEAVVLAQADLRRALHIGQRLRDREVEAQAWTLMAEMARQQDSGLADAEFYLENARAVAYRLHSTLDGEWQDEVSATLALATGRPDLALKSADAALASQQASGRATARTLAMIGTAQLELGHLDQARATFREALTQRRRMHDGDHTRTAGAIHNLALVDYAGGHWADARALAAEALRMRRALLPERHPEVARIGLTLARMQVELDGDPGGFVLAQAAEGQLGGSFGSSHFEAIRARLLVADLALAIGAFDEAGAIVTPAWERVVREDMAHGPILAEALLVEADLAWRAGDASRARRLLAELRTAAGEPLASPWNCARFAALATLLEVDAPACQALPVAPHGETARLLREIAARSAQPEGGAGE